MKRTVPRSLERQWERNGPSALLTPQVLQLLGFQSTHRRGEQWYGHCPVPGCRPSHRPCFSANVAIGRYYCHRCHHHGHQIELWAAVTGLLLYPAAIDLCDALGREVPWMDRW